MLRLLFWLAFIIAIGVLVISILNQVIGLALHIIVLAILIGIALIVLSDRPSS